MEIATTIVTGYLYFVWNNLIVYNGITYNPGDKFYGVAGITTYTGSGYASNIIDLQSASIEAFTEIGDLIFIDKLKLIAASAEMVQPLNGTIFPEQLTIRAASVEVSVVILDDVRIIDC